MTDDYDRRYLKIIQTSLDICKQYKPKFGMGGSGLALDEFQELYSADPFYSWFGLDNPLMYAAHKTLGGLTSIYRQIGKSCETVFRQVLIDHLLLPAEEATWSFEVPKANGGSKTRSLDARIQLDLLGSSDRRPMVEEWIQNAAAHLSVGPKVAGVLEGAVFEVRQGYKSKDSKRQNADLENGAIAYTNGYLPVILLLSTQIDSDVAARYETGRWLVLRGTRGENPIRSTYAFCRETVGYDLAAFFDRNSPALKEIIDEVIKTLLSPTDETTS